MQILCLDALTLSGWFWTAAILIHFLFWLILGPRSRYYGLALYWFETIPRSVALSEVIGAAGAVLGALIDMSSVPALMLLSLLCQPFIAVFVLCGRTLRRSAEQAIQVESSGS